MSYSFPIKRRLNPALLIASCILLPLSGAAFGSDDDDDDDDDDEVHTKAVAALVRPPTSPAPSAKGKIEVEKEDLDEQELEFEAEHLTLGHTFFVFLDDGTGTLVSIGEMLPDDDDASAKSKDDDDDDDDSDDDDDDNSDDDDDDDDDSDDDDDDDFEVKLKFKSKNGVGTLPLGVTDVATLAGRLVEIRDETSAVYLTGAVPTLVGDFSASTAKTSLTPTVSGKAKLKLRSVPKKAKDEFTLDLAKLNAVAAVTVAIEHPTTHVVTPVTTIDLKGNGKGKLRLKTKKGDALPFGIQDAEQLGGLAIEVRNAATSQVLLHGTIPQL